MSGAGSLVDLDQQIICMEVGMGWVGWDLKIPLLVTCTPEYKGLSKKKKKTKVALIGKLGLYILECMFITLFGLKALISVMPFCLFVCFLK